MKQIAIILSITLVAGIAPAQTQKLVVPGSAFIGNGPLANEQTLAAFEAQLNKPPIIQNVPVMQQQAPIVLQAPPSPPDTHLIIVDQHAQAVPSPAPVEPLLLPTVQPVEAATRMNTTVNGIDDIRTRAVLPEHLTIEQLHAVKKIVDNGVLIAQQRFGLEQYEMETTHQVSRLRETKSFVLWGLLLSIPFLMTSYWGLKRLAIAWRNWRRDFLEHKLRELESVERQIAGSEHQYHEIQHS